jgi:hypothetical protein
MSEPTISYCAVVIRTKFVRMLIEDLARKTTVPYEILLWLNVEDRPFEVYVTDQARAGVPVRIVGKTPENIGMSGLGPCFSQAKGRIITQIDDDVIRISPGIAETAEFIFNRRKDVRHLSAAMWESERFYIYKAYGDGWNNIYKPVDPSLELYEGPIDGWFSMYHRDIRPLLLDLGTGGDPYARAAPGKPPSMISVGYRVAQRLRGSKNQRPAICKMMKVFHVKGAVLLSYYDMLGVQAWKFRQLKVDPKQVVVWDTAHERVPPKSEIEPHIQEAYRAVDEPIVLPAQRESSP